MTFEEWWEKNEKQYGADACHMSEYHMASVVWNAAIDECLAAFGSYCDHSERHYECPIFADRLDKVRALKLNIH